MSEGGDYDENGEGYKVFVSRLPVEWTEEHLKSHFELLFGPILSISIFTSDSAPSRSNGHANSKNGCIVFHNLESQQKALEQQVLHIKKKTIHIREYKENYEDDGICFMWKNFNCVHGDNCKFLHDGNGGCVNHSAPGQGKKKCLSFKTKGKCSKGDSCPFLHIAKSTKNSSEVNVEVSKPINSKSGVCNSFKKKGKCRKGDNCRYLHPINSQIDPDTSDRTRTTNGVKRKRIDGQTLVEQRKKLATEEKSLPT